MGHSKKPGTPGRTTIPAEIVTATTKRLLAVFTKRKFDLDHDLFVVPQQCYLYVEVQRRPYDAKGARPPITTSSTTHIPLGRLKFLGDAKKWEYQPYRWSDEFWDEGQAERGTPGDLMLAMLVDTLCS